MGFRDDECAKGQVLHLYTTARLTTLVNHVHLGGQWKHQDDSWLNSLDWGGVICVGFFNNTLEDLNLGSD